MMNNKLLTQAIQAFLNDKIEEATEFLKQYYTSKMKRIVEDAEVGVSTKVRTDFSRALRRHYNRHRNKNQAEQDAYDDVIRHHGKEEHDKLKEYHRTHLKEQELVNEIASRNLGTEIMGQDYTHEVVDGHTGKVVGRYKSLRRASHAADKNDLKYGAVRYHARRIEKKAEGE